MSGKMSPAIPLSEQVAELLDIAGKQLIITEGIEETPDFYQFPGGGLFAALSPVNRLRSIALLEQLKINPSSLPVLFKNNPGFVINIADMLNRLTMMGYYSEWPGYGSTRLKTPEKRRLEYIPAGWIQVGYPGISKGYHALRGYLAYKFTE